MIDPHKHCLSNIFRVYDKISKCPLKSFVYTDTYKAVIINALFNRSDEDDR